jgi:hypothetical protein
VLTRIRVDGHHHGPVPHTPDQAVKDATRERILAHVRRGWPHLDDVVITFRGQFCYVALPGPRRARWRKPAPPSPVLRLRYQGHIDRWKIAIYKYSTETYAEAELPTSFGPRTGTPEEGIDHTFILYAGPSRIIN